MAGSNRTLAVRVFGGPADQAGRSSGNVSNQKQAEVVLDDSDPAGTARRVKGPTKSPGFSFHYGVTEASASGTMTVQFSNLPDPDPDVDGDWADLPTPVTPIDLDATATGFVSVPDVIAEWIRYKALPVDDSASLWLYHVAAGADA